MTFRRLRQWHDMGLPAQLIILDENQQIFPKREKLNVSIAWRIYYQEIFLTGVVYSIFISCGTHLQVDHFMSTYWWEKKLNLRHGVRKSTMFLCLCKWEFTIVLEVFGLITIHLKAKIQVCTDNVCYYKKWCIPE